MCVWKKGKVVFEDKSPSDQLRCEFIQVKAKTWVMLEPNLRWVRTNHEKNPNRPPSAVLDLLLPAPGKGNFW